MTRKNLANRPHIVRRTLANGTVKEVTYDNQRQAIMYTGMSMLDNRYAKSKAEAQTAARGLLNGPVTIGGVTYELREGNGS